MLLQKAPSRLDVVKQYKKYCRPIKKKKESEYLWYKKNKRHMEIKNRGKTWSAQFKSPGAGRFLWQIADCAVYIGLLELFLLK